MGYFSLLLSIIERTIRPKKKKKPSSNTIEYLNNPFNKFDLIFMDWKSKYFKYDILPKLIYRSNATVIQILTRLYICVCRGKEGLDKLTLRFIWKYKEPRRAKTFLKKKPGREGNTLYQILRSITKYSS